MHGLSSISASWSRSKLKTKNTKPMWDHSHNYKQWYTPTATHLTLYFHPLHQPKTPVFAKNCHPKSQCHTVQVSRILEIFHSKTPNRLEFKKKVPTCHLFCYGFCHWKTPYFFALHTFCLFEGNVAQTRSEAGKFCILKTESSNLGNTFRCKFNKGDENKISFLQAQPTQLCIIWMNFIGGQGWYRLLST